VPTSPGWSDRVREAAISQGAIVLGCRRAPAAPAGQAVLRAPIAGRADRDVLPGRSGPVAVPVPVRLEHDRLGEGPVGDRAGPA